MPKSATYSPWRQPPVPAPCRNVGLPRFLLAPLVLVALALSFAACGSSEQSGETIRLVIPAGTTKLLQQGGSSDAIPEKITGRVGDTLVVVNRDEATQFIAGYSVSSGQTLKIPLRRSGSYVTNCSAHRDQSIRMEISD